MPLYLEWAPGNVFGEVPKHQEEDAETSQPKDTKKDDDDSKVDTKTSNKEKKTQKQSTPLKSVGKQWTRCW